MFGRTQMTEGKTGREHNPYGFSLWMAGGWVKGCVTICGGSPVTVTEATLLVIAPAALLITTE